MTATQRAILILSVALVAAAVAGVVYRRRYRLWSSFAVYLMVVMLASAGQAFWPATFHTPAFWQIKETTYVALRFAMAAELAVRTFRSFPGAQAVLHKMVLFILLGTLVALLVAPAGHGYTSFIGELQPRVLNGSVWILTAIAGLILWYRLPVHPFHKAVLLAYVPYVLVFTAAMSYLGDAGWQRARPVLYLNQLAYVVLLVFWNVAIWRRDRAPVARPDQVRPAAASA